MDVKGVLKDLRRVDKNEKGLSRVRVQRRVNQGRRSGGVVPLRVRTNFTTEKSLQ